MEHPHHLSWNDLMPLAARDREIMRVTGCVVAVTLATTLTYAITRYVIFGAIEARNIPLYILNKSFAWSSLLLLGTSMSLGALGRLFRKTMGRHVWQRKYIGLSGFAIATAHICMSLMLFGFAYYRDFFSPTLKLTFIAELSMSFGVIAWLLLFFPAVSSFPSVKDNMSRTYWLIIHHWTLYAVGLSSLHTIYGWETWSNPQGWYGGMPPITLWSFSVFILVVIIRRLGRPKLVDE